MAIEASNPTAADLKSMFVASSGSGLSHCLTFNATLVWPAHLDGCSADDWKPLREGRQQGKAYHLGCRTHCSVLTKSVQY
jgi:hypothetical protein